jgi:hypothetical protein
VTPTHGVPEQLVGDVVSTDGDRTVVDVAGVAFTVRGATPKTGRVAATLAPPLRALDVALIPSAR